MFLGCVVRVLEYLQWLILEPHWYHPMPFSWKKWQLMLLPVNNIPNKPFRTVPKIILIDGITAHHKRLFLKIDCLVFLIILAFPNSNCLPICYCCFCWILIFTNFDCIILDEWKGLFLIRLELFRVNFNKFLGLLFCFLCCFLYIFKLGTGLNYSFGQYFIQFLSNLYLVSRRFWVRSWKSRILIFTLVSHKLSDSFLDNLLAIMIALILAEIAFTGLDQTGCHSFKILRLKYVNLSIYFTTKKWRFNRQYIGVSRHWEH